MTGDSFLSFEAGITVVAGGSGGIGAAIVRALVAGGSDVAFTYHRNQAAAEALRDELLASGRHIECHALELEEADNTASLLADIAARHARLHGVVYAAGPVTPIDYVGKLTSQQWEQTFRADAQGCFHLVHAALPLLKQQGGGSLTAVTTTQYARHVPMSLLSSAPKAAIESLMQVTAREYGRYGIRANAVRSGWLDGGKFADGIGGQVTAQAKQAIVASIPLGQLGQPDDVAKAVVFLVSPAARYITGEALSVDGGWKL